jgi:hypothetical protein
VAHPLERDRLGRRAVLVGVEADLAEEDAVGPRDRLLAELDGLAARVAVAERAQALADGRRGAARRGPVVVTFMFTRFADCAPQLDRVERARARVPGVTFVGVIVREPPGAAQRLVRERGWGYPVALDRDGQVSNVFGIGGCPTTVFADRGGKVRATRIGQLDEAAIVREARALLAPARR